MDNPFGLIYQVDDCVKWISDSKFKSVALQLEKDCLKDAVKLKMALEKACSDPVDFSVLVSDSCSVDYLAPLHLGLDTVDAIIRLGKTCLAPFECSLPILPVLFAFGNYVESDQLQFLRETLAEYADCSSNLVLYSSEFCALVKNFTENFPNFEIGQLVNYSHDWHFTQNFHDIIHPDINGVCGYLGHFWISKPINSYENIFYIGSSINLSLRLVGAIAIDPKTRKVLHHKKSKELTKRISLIERLRSKQSLSIGFIFTNSFVPIDHYMEKIDLMKRKTHKVFKITILHSTDECKLGNFSYLDAFVVINACNCSSLIDSLVLHLPLLTYAEYEILCGKKMFYGGIEWNQEQTALDEEAQAEFEQETGPNNQLVPSYTIDRPSWYGLEMNTSYQPVSFITEGQKGTASGYSSEPR